MGGEGRTWRRVELAVVDVARDRIEESAYTPLFQHVIGDLDVDVL